MIPIGGHTVLTLEDIYRAAFHSRPRYLLPFYGGFLVLAWTHAFWFDPPGAAMTTFLMGVALTVFFAVLWLAINFLVFRRMDDGRRRLTYEIDRERVAMRDDSGAASIIPWSQVRRSREHAAGLALFIRPTGARWLVKRAFSADDWQAVRTFAGAA